MFRELLLYNIAKTKSFLFKNNIAIADNNENKVSFLKLFNDSESLSAGLDKLKINVGERIGVICKNSYNYFPLFFATSKLGLSIVLINKRLSEEEKYFIIKDTEPSLLLIDEEEIFVAKELKKKYPFIREIILMEGSNDSIKLLNEFFITNKTTPINGKEDLPYIIIHTAATDGKPRGGVLSQKNVILASLQMAMALCLTKKDSYLNILPLFHIMGINLSLSTLIIGGKNVIIPSFDARLSVDLIRKENISLLGTFPPILQSILSIIEKENVELNSLQKVVGLEQQEIIDKLESKTNAEFWNMYGQTETSGLICLAPNKEKKGSAGRPLVLSDISIVDENDRELPPEKVGEIALRGPLVFLGYWNRDKDNKYTFRNQIHHTGDLGILDKDGYLFFKGRKPEKELIKSGGENVFPTEVEEIILMHPDILEVCVIGVPDPKFGEGIKAVCVKKPQSSLTEQELINFVGEKIARYKKPRYVEFIDKLPKDQNGNTNRLKVKESYGKNKI